MTFSGKPNLANQSVFWDGTKYISGTIPSSGLLVGSIAIGDVVCPANLLDTTKITKAFPAARIAGGLSYGVALVSGVDGDIITFAGAGAKISAAISGLGAGVSTDIIVNDSARLARKTKLDGSEHIIGHCDTLGNVVILPSHVENKPVFNVKNAPYFAKGDNTTDDYAAIQQAITDCGILGEGGTVFFPLGKYKISKPLWIQSSNVTLKGSGYGPDVGGQPICAINAMEYPSFAGPAILVAPPSGAIPIPTFTTVGNYNYAAWAGINSEFIIDFRDTDCGDLDGTTAFCLEFNVHLTADLPGTTICAFAGSGGGYGTTDVRNGFQFLLYGPGIGGVQNQISISLKTAIPKNISSSTNASPISVNAVGHGLVTGNRVSIQNHTVNTNANGRWIITRTDANNFTLNDSTGNGVGGATGTVFNVNPAGVSVNSSTPLTKNIDHNLKLSYDGAFIRLYIDGVFDCKVACTGTFILLPNDDFVFGSYYNSWPLSGRIFNAPPMRVASIRLSATTSSVGSDMTNAAHYVLETGGTVYPTSLTELTDNSYTYLLINFGSANRNDILVRGKTQKSVSGIRTGSTDVWFVWKEGIWTSGGISTVSVDDINIRTQGCAIESITCQNLRIENVWSTSFCRGIDIQNNSFDSYCNNIYPIGFGVDTSGGTSGGRGWGFVMRGASGVCKVGKLQTKGNPGKYPVVFFNSGVIVENAYPSTYGTEVGIFVKQSNSVFNYINPSTEGGAAPSDSHMMLVSCNTVVVSGGTLEQDNQPQTSPNLIIESCGNVSLSNEFTGGIHAIEFRGTQTGPTMVLSPKHGLNSPEVPWMSDDPAKQNLLLIVSQELGGSSTFNFTSDANALLPMNTFLWRVVNITDTGPVLTAMRDLTIPNIVGYERTFNNNTLQTIRIMPGAFSILAGQSLTLRNL